MAEAEAGADPSDTRGMAAGFARNASRYLRHAFKAMKRVKPEFQLRLPKELPRVEFRLPKELPKYEFRIPTRSVSKSAEQLRSAMELRENILETRHQEGSSAARSEHVADSTKRTGAWRGLAVDGLHAMPGFIRSVALTTMVFTIYEEGMERVHHQKRDRVSSGILTLAPVGLGFAGGLCHGYMSTLSEYAHHRFTRPMKFETQFGRWTAVSHALVYSALFGSYEGTKYALVRVTNTKKEDILRRALCISAAGAASGYISEVVAHFTRHIERNNIFTTGMASARQQTVPSVRACAPGIFMSIFGFLAYEYASDLNRHIILSNNCGI